MAAKPAAAKPTEKTSKIEGKAGAQTEQVKGEKAAPFRSKYKPEQIITLLVDYNPKRPNSAAHASFECYEDEQTVKEFLDNGGLSISLNWDVEHGFIKIGDTFDAKAAKQSKPAPAPKAEKQPKAAKAAKAKAVDLDEEDDE